MQKLGFHIDETKRVKGHPSSKYAKFFEKLVFLIFLLCTCQGVRHVSFSRNFGYLLNR